MTSLETKFVDGLFWKTLIIGAVSALIGWWVMSVHFAGSVGLGVLVGAFNLRVVSWISRKILQAGAQGSTSSAFWSLLLVIKLFVLFVLTFVFVIIVGANVFGYIIGYSTFLLAIVWQLALYMGREDDLVEDGDTESL
ncbi:hypothetical protein FIV42_08800 [Persicimonas caeni]|jgi:hypothetical protein|uniref:Uncharacterized protein n=1 Tax=Persicimonas caeni TaxID=2292766 RepID=A0A4Y6PR94_PERCE|nr:hypothetical protein [Persicimonas caeni]QDG50826.1 hypothetical protein FIV42_08800 [Persicimonas caeni]QED32047.1 hypothetical protein FRD00_08795 [Persicimonas caeni]